MSVSGIGGPGFERPVDEAPEGAAEAAPAAPAEGGVGRSALGSLAAAATGTANLRPLYGRWETFLNGVSKIFGGDREMAELSDKITSAKDRAFADRTLTRAELDGLRGETDRISRTYSDIAARRGFPAGAVLPASPDQFKVHAEGQEIHFQWLAGRDLKGGAAAELARAARSGGGPAAEQVAKKIAFDIATSPSEAIARDKVSLLRAALSHVPDRAAQTRALDLVGGSLAEVERSLGVRGPLPPAAFQRASRFESTASVHETPLPAEVRGTNKLFPNRPIPGWEETTRAATKASLDDLDKAGKLFLDKIPPGAGTKTVALKLDLNLGADGPPSVTDPATAGATISELLERAKADGKPIRFTVGDSAGGENIGLGRTTMDIMRDTGNYHHALKAGLKFAAGEGGAEAGPARAALAKVEDAERRGAFFGGKDDKVSTPADLKAAEAAAAKYVVPVDYDAAGYASVDPKLGPLGLASWGTREFQIAKPWAEADFRVHVARGASTHLLAGWTGATKGLIGLHAFGLRPADQGMNKLGQDMVTGLSALSQAGGFAAIFAQRTGTTDLLAKIAAGNDPVLKEGLKKMEARWDNLKGNVGAWKTFSEGTARLAAELHRDRKAGMSEPALAEKMRTQTRAILDRADTQTPGFRQAMWDTMHEATRFMLVAANNFRGVIPDALKDDQLGARIGLLTSLPYQSDLVVQTQPKLGEGGGPDAYRNVRDVGVVIAATDEATADALAWKRAGQAGNLWEKNLPVHAALRHGRGPMHLDEVKDVTNR